MRLSVSFPKEAFPVAQANSGDLIAGDRVQHILSTRGNLSQSRKRTEGWENQKTVALPEARHSLRFFIQANARMNMPAQFEVRGR